MSRLVGLLPLIFHHRPLKASEEAPIILQGVDPGHGPKKENSPAGERKTLEEKNCQECTVHHLVCHKPGKKGDLEV